MDIKHKNGDKMKEDLKLIIFDMDGVIFDSEPLHHIAKTMILKDYNIPTDIDLEWSIGRSIIELWENIIKKYEIDNMPEALELRQYKYIVQQMKEKNTQESLGLREILGWAKKKYKIAIASSSNRFFVNQVLEFLMLQDYFDFTIAGDEVSYRKPQPDLYLAALQKAELLPEEAIAIEDSKAGIDAAKAAGIICIGYHNPSSGDQDLSKSDYVIHELSEIENILINKLI